MSFDRASELQKPTLPGFIAWLERKDPNERYEWPKSEICACGQYAKEVGEKNWQSAGDSWSRLNQLARGPVDLNSFETATEANWTFGQLLDRAKAELVR